jgi:hypothetical protein
MEYAWLCVAKSRHFAGNSKQKIDDEAKVAADVLGG